MTLVDVNLLLHAAFQEMPEHQAAKLWLEQALNGSEIVALPWVVLCAFIRIGTNPRIMIAPLTVDEALAQVDEWLDLPSVRIIGPTERHRFQFTRMVREAQAAGNLVTDAHWAALATEHGCRLASLDSDFRKFPGLDWFNPIN
jgi:toxin-antitoxin system PIN domain toxin